MKKIILIFFALIITISCKKQENWLDVKSNKADVVPTTLNDFQAIMDNSDVLSRSHQGIGMIGSDNYYLTDVSAQTLGILEVRNAYIWASDIYEGETLYATDWKYPYQAVEYCNVVLDGIQKIYVNAQNQLQYNNVKGSALFFRAYSFFILAQVYAKPYDKNNAGVDLGIPLKLSSDINEKISRATIEQTYNRMILDLTESADLLPDEPLYKTRPSKIAAYALLARIYLEMGDYEKTYSFADRCLKIKSSLLNFNTITTGLTYIFPTYASNTNSEIFFWGEMSNNFTSINSLFVVDELYNSYDSKDLRKNLFFRINADSTKSFRGRYSGRLSLFAGFATNELYLIKSEAEARLGRFTESMSTLNTLLITRWATNNFIPYTASDETQALTIILKERRKELPFTSDLRWQDLRRFNKDPRFAKTLNRTVAGKTYTLLPNDQKYVLPIPPSEMNINNLPQNER